MEKADISSSEFIESIEGLSGLSFQIHKDFIPIYVTEAYARLYGFESTEDFMQLESILPLIPGELHEVSRERYKQVIETGRSEPKTIKTRKLNGETLWLKVQDRRIHYKGDYCLLTALVDISEEVRLKEAFELAAENEKQAREKLEQLQDVAIQNEKHEALTELLRGISHQLNTPLGNIRTSASVLSDAVVETEKRQKSATLTASALADMLQETSDAAFVIKRSVSKAASLIESVKQLVADKSNGDRCEFSLAKVVNDAVNLSLHSENINNIKVENHLDPSIIAFANPNDWITIISVLTNNVYQHAIAPDERGTITVEGKYRDQQFILRFSDDGVGVDENSHRKIFEAFYSTRLGQHNGIGLALAHSLVTRSLNGTIHALNNTPEKGASFIIKLPQDDYRNGADN